MRKERLARGWSVHEFAKRSGISAGHVSRIENGKRPPTQAVATACDAVFPERRGWFSEFYDESRTWMLADSATGQNTRTRRTACACGLPG